MTDNQPSKDWRDEDQPADPSESHVGKRIPNDIKKREILKNAFKKDKNGKGRRKANPTSNPSTNSSDSSDSKGKGIIGKVRDLKDKAKEKIKGKRLPQSSETRQQGSGASGQGDTQSGPGVTQSGQGVTESDNQGAGAGQDEAQGTLAGDGGMAAGRK